MKLENKVYDDLRRKFGGDPICGYMRKPMTINQSEIVRGHCSLFNKTCTKQVPFEAQDCKDYQKWLERTYRKKL